MLSTTCPFFDLASSLMSRGHLCRVLHAESLCHQVVQPEPVRWSPKGTAVLSRFSLLPGFVLLLLLSLQASVPLSSAEPKVSWTSSVTC